jgi:ribosomal protein S18 acetylase RimI-like enzyme
VEAMEVFVASSEHLEEVSKLFDRYRIFYQQPSDIESARKFLQARFQKNDSTVFVARDHGYTMGFTQLYPSFSSVSMQPIWILNDLFVEETYRRRGVAHALMKSAENFARETGAIRITLSTQVTNVLAQALYESLGYKKNQDFHHYALQL